MNQVIRRTGNQGRELRRRPPSPRAMEEKYRRRLNIEIYGQATPAAGRPAFVGTAAGRPAFVGTTAGRGR